MILTEYEQALLQEWIDQHPTTEAPAEPKELQNLLNNLAILACK